MFYALRKSFGPLSAGTRVDVLSIPEPERRWHKSGDVIEHGYAHVRLTHVSRALRSILEKHPQYRNLLSPFDIEVDMLVQRRG